LGSIFVLISVIILIYSLISYFSGNATSGWTSLIVSIWAIGGLNLIAIGIIGEYVGKVFLETKRRPRYIIEEYLK
ncbi:MAG: glycosyltransferase, partial [Clostridia bacterium]|nr:glycosyltransferase [Clostridia bacterium]